MKLPYEWLDHYLYAHFESMRWSKPSVEFTTKVQPALAADFLGVNRITIYRWITYGVPLNRADKIAAQLSTHPMEIWPSHYLEAIPCA